MLFLFFFYFLSAPTVAGDLHGSLDSGRCVLRPSPIRSSSEGFRRLLLLLVVALWGCSASALRARDVRGSLGHMISDGMRKASGSKDSSVVVMHGHRMRSDFDLDSVVVPHSRSFSLCSSVVSKVSNSSQSIKSCGEHGSALGHKISCNLHAAGVQGGTKALSMSIRLGVGRPAVEKLASPQQAPGRLHEEAWAGLLQKQCLRISQKMEIVPGCAVVVACPSCPDHSLEQPGPGRVIRNMLGWSQLEKTAGSAVRVPSKGRIFFLPLT